MIWKDACDELDKKAFKTIYSMISVLGKKQVNIKETEHIPKCY